MCCSSARVLMAALLALVLFSTAVRADNEIELQRDLEYGRGGDQTLRLHLARPKEAQGPLPVVVAIHGGGWRGGNKEMHIPNIEALAREGFLAVSIGYRLAPEHRFPAQIEDCKCAIRWLRAHASELNIDPQRIGAIGWSAGAHLAMMLGTMDAEDGFEGDGGWPDYSSKVQAVVAYAGPTDLTAEYPEEVVPIVEGFIGGSQSEMPDRYRQASPVTYVSPGDAAMLIFHGTADTIVPYQQAVTMVIALSEADVPGRVEFLIGEGHGLRPEDAVRPDRAALEFFKQWLKPDGR